MVHGTVLSLDVYRKVREGYLESSKWGPILSILYLAVMTVLISLETLSFLQRIPVTSLSLDKPDNTMLRINFNITMMDMPCSHAVMDVISDYGTEQNVTKHISRMQIDAAGVDKRYHTQLRTQHDLVLWDETVTQTVEEMMEYDGAEDADTLTMETFDIYRNTYKFLFVDFYTSWCQHCQDMAPTWEALAKVMWLAAAHFVKTAANVNGTTPYDGTDDEYRQAIQLQLPVKIAKVDCAEQGQLCTQQGIRAYPTLRLFVDGKPFTTDYDGHRTVVDFTDYLLAIETATTMDETDRNRAILSYADNYARQARMVDGGVVPTDRFHRTMKPEYLQPVYPGCQLSGFLLVNRVPGKFHIQARSVGKEFDPAMTNVSHIIHHLSFGEPYMNRKFLKVTAADSSSSASPYSGVSKHLSPMKNTVYVTHNAHEAHHHYLKVVPTYIQHGEESYQPTAALYQFLQQSQLTYVSKDYPPEAQFQYDISPIAVTYGFRTTKWYDYIITLLAIVGGIFSIFTMMHSLLPVTPIVHKWCKKSPSPLLIQDTNNGFMA